MDSDKLQSGSKSLAAKPVPAQFTDLEQVRQQLVDIYEQLDRINRDVWRDIHNIESKVLPDVDINIEIDFDVPLMGGITLSVDGGVPKWTAGTIQFGGTQYSIDAWEAGDTTANTRGIYWTETNEGSGKLQTKFYGQDTPTHYKGRWFVAFFDGTTIYNALQSTIIHGGLVQASTITATQIASNTITANEIAANAITASEIAANAVTASEIAANAVDTSELNANAVTAVKIAANQVTADKISVSNLAAINADLGTITAGTINSTAIVNAGAISTGTLNCASLTVTNLNASSITAGTISTAVLTIADLDTVSCTDLGTNIVAGTISGITGTFVNLTAKTSVQVGPDEGDGNFTIAVTAGGVAQAIAKRIDSGRYHTTVMDKDGFRTFARVGAWADTTATTHQEVRIGGMFSNNLFKSLYAGVSGFSGGITSYLGVSDSDASFGKDASTKITADGSGVVDVPAAALSGTISTDRIPDITGKSVSGFSASDVFTLWSATTAAIKATSPATGTLAYVNDDATPRPVYYDGAVWRYASSNNAL